MRHQISGPYRELREALEELKKSDGPVGRLIELESKSETYLQSEKGHTILSRVQQQQHFVVHQPQPTSAPQSLSQLPITAPLPLSAPFVDAQQYQGGPRSAHLHAAATTPYQNIWIHHQQQQQQPTASQISAQLHQIPQREGDLYQKRQCSTSDLDVSALRINSAATTPQTLTYPPLQRDNFMSTQQQAGVMSQQPQQPQQQVEQPFQDRHQQETAGLRQPFWNSALGAPSFSLQTTRELPVEHDGVTPSAINSGESNSFAGTGENACSASLSPRSQQSGSAVMPAISTSDSSRLLSMDSELETSPRSWGDAPVRPFVADDDNSPRSNQHRVVSPVRNLASQASSTSSSLLDQNTNSQPPRTL